MIPNLDYKFKNRSARSVLYQIFYLYKDQELIIY